MAERIVAAGGIVRNEDKAILLMLRRGKWDLPKGKLDDGESIEECAVREVEEETGLQLVVLGELVGITHHLYEEKGKQIEKETYWYAMEVTGNQQLVPQEEEDILELRWVREEELSEYLSNTYDNIIEIVERYYDNKNQIN
ncbi:NUDIX domain-containing protein [Segetibacter sp. 3557_3]|uniref:NUDIX hydrolase n=1 Tax=Segetibacter sp. 3557_3 TaxID=2547429 RepID=UPI00105867FF|nr:NUDIX domain-containing protein [Segetibacter sp. 3557_3]TDH29300.1 NUDIX domain-containing protein [Segetibacter sp. 3557_3]